MCVHMYKLWPRDEDGSQNIICGRGLQHVYTPLPWRSDENPNQVAKRMAMSTNFALDSDADQALKARQ